ncbi:hypothetical protein B0H14DRAFT_3751551 [Mycena olivaceomarginata]|nr:hypothetical protein B0H14DRAFT_3751551 [Mycena olivaceomarginata]
MLRAVRGNRQYCCERNGGEGGQGKRKGMRPVISAKYAGADEPDEVLSCKIKLCRADWTPRDAETRSRRAKAGRGALRRSWMAVNFGHGFNPYYPHSSGPAPPAFAPPGYPPPLPTPVGPQPVSPPVASATPSDSAVPIPAINPAKDESVQPSSAPHTGASAHDHTEASVSDYPTGYVRRECIAGEEGRKWNHNKWVFRSNGTVQHEVVADV